jgi:NitT/TauT family transport system permease protein
MIATRAGRGVARRRAGRSGRGSSLAIGIGTLAVLVALGELIPRSGLISRTVMPTPGDTVKALEQLLSSDYWLDDLRSTLTAVVIAWVLGCAAGLVLGTAIGISAFVRKVVTPYAVAIQALPKIVLAPLLIGWLGFGASSKIAIAVAICFFPVWVDTMIGLSLPSAAEFKLMASLKASRWQTFRMLQFPAALPLIMVGIKHAMLLSFTGVLVAEILSASAGGLGTLAEEFARQLQMPLTFAVVAIVIVLAVTLVSLLDVLEQKLVFWSESARERGR